MAYDTLRFVRHPVPPNAHHTGWAKFLRLWVEEREVPERPRDHNDSGLTGAGPRHEPALGYGEPELARQRASARRT